MLAPAWMTWRWRDAQRKRRAAGSMPLLGSSMSTTGGAPTSATATLSLRRLPPEYVSHALKRRIRCVRMEVQSEGTLTMARTGSNY